MPEVLASQSVKGSARDAPLILLVDVPSQVPVRVDDALEVPERSRSRARARDAGVGRGAVQEEDAAAIGALESISRRVGAAADDQVERSFGAQEEAAAGGAVDAVRRTGRHQLLAVDRVSFGAVVVRHAKLGVDGHRRNRQVPTHATPAAGRGGVVGQGEARPVGTAPRRKSEWKRDARRALAVSERRLDEVDVCGGLRRLQVLDRGRVEGGRARVVRSHQHGVDHEGEVSGFANDPLPLPIDRAPRQRLPGLGIVVVEEGLDIVRSHPFRD